MSEYKDEILHHNYDGIQEYDNPMPAWWKNIFYLTIVWSGVYLVGLGFGHIWDYDRELNEGQKELVAMRRAYEEAQPPVVITDEMLAAALDNKEQLELGKQAFNMNCAACHGDQGQGDAPVRPDLNGAREFRRGMHRHLDTVAGIEAVGRIGVLPGREARLAPGLDRGGIGAVTGACGEARHG